MRISGDSEIHVLEDFFSLSGSGPEILRMSPPRLVPNVACSGRKLHDVLVWRKGSIGTALWAVERTTTKNVPRLDKAVGEVRPASTLISSVSVCALTAGAYLRARPEVFIRRLFEGPGARGEEDELPNPVSRCARLRALRYALAIRNLGFEAGIFLQQVQHLVTRISN